jgi:hypothetical protein
MATATNDTGKFSIFDPVVTFAHKEFYERVIGELNGIFPICNQGKCTAVEISENSTEQRQMTDLMQRVELFSRELLDVTKKLFDQFYQAKDMFYKSILTTTAYNTINLMDRNLLERTCDVRWWAMEGAFSDCLAFFRQVGTELELAKVIVEAHRMKNTGGDKAFFSAAPAVLDNAAELLGQGVAKLIDPDKRDALLKMADEMETVLAENGGKEAGTTLRSLVEQLAAGYDKAQYSCTRLEDIKSSYTLYRDLVIVDGEGVIIANANPGNRALVLGLNVSDEEWFQKALATRDGTEYHAQDLGPSKVEAQDSLIYSTAVRAGGSTSGPVIGGMGVFFDFQGEANLILREYLPKDKEARVLDGWYTFFTNEKGLIITSSDDAIFPSGEHAHIPRTHRQLKKGEKISSYAVVEGRDSAIFSAKTDGYLEYGGLGWTAHIVVPRNHIFNSEADRKKNESDSAKLMDSLLIPDINKQTYEKIQEDKESIQLISLNGIVFASKLGKRGIALSPIFDQITKTGDFVTNRMEELLNEMAVGELEQNLKALEAFSKQAIDLVDRNLFERAADIRWWATDQYFWKALMAPNQEKFNAASERLRVINANYTMYRNLVLADFNGDIVACSRTELKRELIKMNVSDNAWFQQGMRTTSSTQYAVQDVAKSTLEKHKDVSLIYAGGIRADGARDGESIGVLGVMFDWDTEAEKILQTCLPKDRVGQSIEGSVALYTNGSGMVVESTDKERFAIGSKLELPATHAALEKGQSASGFLSVKDKTYIIGSTRTMGYREYAGLGWRAHILRPFK